MSSKMPVVTRNLCLTIVAMLSAMAAGVCKAAVEAAIAETATAAPQQRTDEVEVIDEIWVRGEHLSRVIEDAEDDFFKLYNKLNKVSDYDVFCGTMALNPGSMIMQRKCVPGFVAYNSYDVRNNSVSLGDFGSYTPSTCSSVMTSYDSNGDAFFTSGSCYSSFSGSSSFPMGAENFGASAISGSNYVPSRSAAALLESRSLEYGNNVLKVVSSDSRLLEMVKSLGGLYTEMESLQDRFIILREAGQETRPTRKSGKAYVNPRSL